MLQCTVAEYSDIFLLDKAFREGRVDIFCEAIFGCFHVSIRVAVAWIKRSYSGDIVLSNILFLQWN